MALSKKRLQRLAAAYKDNEVFKAIMSVPTSAKMQIAAEDGKTPAQPVQVRSWALNLFSQVDELKQADGSTLAGLIKAGDTLHGILNGSLSSIGTLVEPLAEGVSAPPATPHGPLQYNWNPSMLAVRLGVVPALTSVVKALAGSDATPQDTLPLRMKTQLLLAQASSWGPNKSLLAQGQALACSVAALAGSEGTKVMPQQVWATLLLVHSLCDAVVPPTAGDGCFGILGSLPHPAPAPTTPPTAAAAGAGGDAAPTAVACRSWWGGELVEQKVLPFLVSVFRTLKDPTNRVFVVMALGNLLASSDPAVVQAASDAGAHKLLSLAVLTDALSGLPAVPAPLATAESLCGILGLLACPDAQVRVTGAYLLRTLATAAAAAPTVSALVSKWQEVGGRDAVWLGWGKRTVPDVLQWLADTGGVVPIAADLDDAARTVAWSEQGEGDSKVKEAAAAAVSAWKVMQEAATPGAAESKGE